MFVLRTPYVHPFGLIHLTEPTAKYTKAQELGVKIITEAELKAMVTK